jgi:ERCC4-type nuclease
MKIILDEREHGLFEKLAALAPNNITKQVLPLGDILIQTDDGKDVLLIERKSFSDLLASIKDGRYEEQSYRLIHSSGFPTHSIIYVIEGMFSQVRTPQEKKMILSAMTSINVFKGFSTHRTSTVTETAEWIFALTDKLDREIKKGHFPPILVANSANTIALEGGTNEEEQQQNQMNQMNQQNQLVTVSPYCSVVKKVKRDNITPANIGEIILCQIPGISSVTAVAIMHKFSSFSVFMDEIKANPACLDGMTYEQNGKPRKINKTSIENIKLYLLAVNC